MKADLSLIAAILASLLFTPAFAAPADLYQDPRAPLEKRVEDLLGRLTQDEKVHMLGGADATWMAIPRLGVPALRMVDGGLGVRGLGVEKLATQEGPATAFPGGVTMAATWNTDLMRRTGEAIAEEAINKGTAGAQILLGPAVNIHRSPLGGRNGEYLTEDPYLASRMTVAYIRGVQSTGIGACIKHFACNNQETDRGDIDVQVGERALREIYFPAFEAAVKEAGVLSVMTSYNLLNGRHATDNPYLLIDVLKKGWGFDGVVMSDWGAVHSTTAVQSGNDIQMPWGDDMKPEKVKACLENGSLAQSAIDDAVRRILRTIIRLGLLEGTKKMDPGKVNSPEHRRLAYEVAAQGIVLLKNDGNLLPLDPRKIRSIAVIGEGGKHLQFAGLGSPEVNALRSTSLLEGIAKESPGTKVSYISTEPADSSLPLESAKTSDVAIVCVSTMRGEREGQDRASFDLPGGQANLIRKVAAANPRTIVIINNGTPVATNDWIEKVPAALEAWLPGQEGGAALAAILFGDVNPSGKLPDTLAVKREDYPDFPNFPGAHHHVDYQEGIYVGYRHFDRKGIAPAFPFGHGLSYTTFGYGNLKLSQPGMQPNGEVTASVDVTNTGKLAGEEVVQLYLHDPKPQIDRPVRELKGFSKIALQPGEIKTVNFTLKPRDLAYFDVPGKQWKANAGTYEIEVGSSSRDIRSKAPLELDAVYTESVPLSLEHDKG